MVRVAEFVRKCAGGFMDIRWKPHHSPEKMFRGGRGFVGWKPHSQSAANLVYSFWFI